MITPFSIILHKLLIYCNFVYYMVCYENSQGVVKGAEYEHSERSRI